MGSTWIARRVIRPWLVSTRLAATGMFGQGSPLRASNRAGGSSLTGAGTGRAAGVDELGGGLDGVQGVYGDGPAVEVECFEQFTGVGRFVGPGPGDVDLADHDSRCAGLDATGQRREQV